MQKLSPILAKGHKYWHYCPACESIHGYDDRWKWNGNIDRPSFTPSMKMTWSHWEGEEPPKENCCHYFVTDGQIIYCGDCTHELVGKTIPMPVIPDNYFLGDY